MKIVLDLKHSYNNYEWEDKEELKKYIEENMLPILWNLYNKNSDNVDSFREDLSTEELNRLYDILDMFNKYEIKESK